MPTHDSSGDWPEELVMLLEAARPQTADPAVYDRVWHKIVAEVDELAAHQALIRSASSCQPPSPRTVERIWRQVIQVQDGAASPPALFRWGGLASRLLAATAAILLVALMAGSLDEMMQQALPDTPLYPVKRSVEKMQVWWAPAEERDDYWLALAIRRQQESDWMIEQQADPALVATAVADFVDHLMKASASERELLADPGTQNALGETAIEVQVDAFAKKVAAWPTLYQEAARPALARLPDAKPQQDGLVENSGTAETVAIVLPAEQAEASTRLPTKTPTPLATKTPALKETIVPTSTSSVAAAALPGPLSLAASPEPTPTRNATQIVAELMVRLTPTLTPTRPATEIATMPSVQLVPTSTLTMTPTQVVSVTLTPTATATAILSATATVTNTPVPQPPTPTPTLVPDMPTRTATSTPTPTPDTPTWTATSTPTPLPGRPTRTLTSTPTPIQTPTPTASDTPTMSPTPTPECVPQGGTIPQPTPLPGGTIPQPTPCAG